MASSGIDSTGSLVSVVIPVYNRTDLLLQCLASLMKQTYAHFEIILVDDGSTIHIEDIVQQWYVRQSSEQSMPPIRIVRQPNGGPASARNTGIFTSAAAIIAFIDSDCTASPDWLASLVDGLTAANAAGIGGPIGNAQSQEWIVRYLDAARFYRHRKKNGIVEYLLTASAAFTRSALLAVGGYTVLPGVWGEDADLSFRLRDRGYSLAITQHGLVTHYGAPRSLRAFAHSIYRYGHGNAILSRQWPGNRHPAIELVRHVGAAVLSPVLALRLAKRVPISQALSFIPLMIIEHGAFSAGLLSGWQQRNKGSFPANDQQPPADTALESMQDTLTK